MRPPISTCLREFLRSNLLGLIAIFIALSGTAVALPGKNNVDSGDIKRGQVKTSDLANAAVTTSKLGANSVDSSRVINDSLTGGDIDESSLTLPQPPSSLARRIVIPPAALLPAGVDDPTIGQSQGFQAVSFDPTTDDSAFAITEVPIDRAPDSALQVRLLWDANDAGDAIWNVGFRTAGPGETVSAPPAGADVAATSVAVATMVETTVLEIPAGAVENGESVALQIRRNADLAGDTLTVFARLRLVEIRYTATG